MRFTASSTNYDFDNHKVLINDSPKRRSIHVTHIDGKGEFLKIGTSYRLRINFFDLDENDKDDLTTIFNDDYGDITAITNIDEVASGDIYGTYSGNIYIESPKENLEFRRSTNFKQIRNWRTQFIITCDTYAEATKP